MSDGKLPRGVYPSAGRYGVRIRGRWTGNYYDTVAEASAAYERAKAKMGASARPLIYVKDIPRECWRSRDHPEALYKCPVCGAKVVRRRDNAAKTKTCGQCKKVQK
jgi:hypothetical protein